jgi:hypothetical protein
MTNSDKEPGQDSASLPTGDPALSDILSAWQQVYKACSVHLRKSSDLVLADLSLSLKGILLTLVCVLLMVGLTLIFWSILLVSIFYSLHLFGLHWLFNLMVILLANIAAFSLVKAQYSNATNAISMKASTKKLFGVEQSKANATGE